MGANKTATRVLLTAKELEALSDVLTLGRTEAGSLRLGVLKRVQEKVQKAVESLDYVPTVRCTHCATELDKQGYDWRGSTRCTRAPGSTTGSHVAWTDKP